MALTHEEAFRLKFPNHHKFKQRLGDVAAISSFLKWLEYKKFRLHTPSGDLRNLLVPTKGQQALIAQYLEIDPEQLDAERRQIFKEFGEMKERHEKEIKPYEDCIHDVEEWLKYPVDTDIDAFDYC